MGAITDYASEHCPLFGLDSSGRAKIIGFDFYGSSSSNYLLWDAPNNKLTMYGTHLSLQTDSSDKNVRINNQTYTTAASIVGMQCKPRAGVAMTAGIYGAEFEPGINSGFAGVSICGVASRPTIKGTAAGNITGVVDCFEAALGSDTGSVRTITGPMSCLHAINNTHGTVTNGIFVINADAAGGNTAWTGFLRVAATGAAGVVVSSDGMVKDPEGDTEAGYISIYVGSTRYEIPFYAIA